MRIESQAEPIPGYTLLERLGGGGFGEVWKCEAPGGLLKAIKFVYGDLHASDEEGQRRPEQELKALKRVKTVRHPYLLSLERFDVIEGRLLIVMELADRNLWDRFKECRGQGLPGIPREELLRYLEEAAEVLDLMNSEYGLQHLDIKPQNLFLVHNHVKVADFGLVKDLQGMQATVTGGVTPVYAAPETFDGIVSRYCDQYSLAIVYQELLTGQRPFGGSSVQQLIMQHLTGTPNLTPLPVNDRPAIGRGLAKKPEERHPTCGDMIRALRNPSAGNFAATPAPSVAAAPIPAAEAVTPPSPAARPSQPPRLAQPARDVTATPQPAVSPSDRTYPQPLPARAAPPAGPSRIIAPEAAAVEDEKPPPAPPEIRGDGVLFPALIVGLGHLGLEVVDRLRGSLQDRFGSTQVLPNLRFLYFDTDPETVQEAQQGNAAVPWASTEAVLARLQRASHYLKPREGRIRIETFCEPRVLYRIPRNPLTSGLRGLGRVALFDNYRLIAGRLQAELEAALDPDALTGADRNTRLGLRTNRPRVYLITSLAGGTGSGMFLDLAYLVRAQLRRLGYERPEVIGLFLVPPADTDPSHTLALANTYAALVELQHFSTSGVSYQQKFDEREKMVTDTEAPFRRAWVFALPEDPRSRGGNKAVSLAADLLARELTTPLGRAADARRPAPPVRTLTLQTAGLYRFSWPRRSLMQRAARYVCKRLLDRWTAKDAGALRSTVQTWVADQWTKQDLAAETLIERLQKACAQAVGQPPEDIFTTVLQPMAPRGRRGPEVTPEAAAAALDRFEQLLGRPEEVPSGRKSLPLAEALDQESQILSREGSAKVAQLAVCLLEQPEFRLTGAEEAIRQITATVNQVLEHYEPLAKELSDRALDAHQRLYNVLSQLQANPGRRGAALAAELYDLLRYYPKTRYQSQVLRRVITVYLGLRGQLTDQIREVGFVRQRLGDLVKQFEEAAATGRLRASGPGEFLLPTDCENLQEAIDHLRESIADADVIDLDRALQPMIQQQFNGVMAVCMAKANLMKNLEAALQQEAEQFLSGRLAGGDVVEMFLVRHGQVMDALPVITHAFEAAAPELAMQVACPNQELNILALPDGPHAADLTALIQQALAGIDLVRADSTDDIVFYREQPHLPLARLEQAGELGQAAFDQFLRVEGFMPHSRTDIGQWQAIEPE